MKMNARRPQQVNLVEIRLAQLERYVWWLRLWVGLGMIVLVGMAVVTILFKIKGAV